MLCLSEGELHGIVFKGPTGFTSRCHVNGDFLEGPNRSLCAHGLWQGLRCGGVGVHRFRGSSSSGSQDLFPDAVLQDLSQPVAGTMTAAVGALLQILQNPYYGSVWVLLSDALGIGQGNATLLKWGYQI